MSDCADAQADMGLHCLNRVFEGRRGLLRDSVSSVLRFVFTRTDATISAIAQVETSIAEMHGLARFVLTYVPK